MPCHPSTNASSDETLEQLPKSSLVGKAKVGGIDFNKERMRWAGQAVLTLAASAGRFTACRLAEQVRSSTGQTSSQYGPRRAAYDLRKLRAKNMVHRIGKGRRYDSPYAKDNLTFERILKYR